MKPVPKVTTSDFLRVFLQEVPAPERQGLNRQYTTHADRQRVHAEFKSLWKSGLGDLFECPSDNDLFTFLNVEVGHATYPYGRRRFTRQS
jgi:hypothetical protein